MVLRFLLAIAQIGLLAQLEPPGRSTNEQTTQSTTKPAATGAAATETPEQVLSAFLTAMLERDDAGIRRTALPDRELSILLNSQPLTATQKAIAKAALNPASFRRLKVGDRITLHGGKTILLDKSRINERRQEITLRGAPLPFILVNVNGEWKVDASALVAARNAAAATRERATASRAKWMADAKLMDQLGNETTVDDLKFRPPASFRTVKVPIPIGRASGWTGAPRKNGSFPSIVVLVIPDEADANRPLGTLVEESLVEIQKRYGADWTRSPVELGQIDNLPSARARWSATLVAGRKDVLGRKTRGVLYLIKHGSKFVQVMIQDAAQGADKSLPICEASALTLRRASDGPANASKSDAQK